MGPGMPATCAQWGLLFQKDWECWLIQARSVEGTRESFSHGIVVFVYGEGGCACDIETQLPGEVVVFTCSIMSDSATSWTIAHQSPLSLGFPRQEYWSGLPFLSPGDVPDPGIEPTSPAWQADSFPVEPHGKPHGRCVLRDIWQGVGGSGYGAGGTGLAHPWGGQSGRAGTPVPGPQLASTGRIPSSPGSPSPALQVLPLIGPGPPGPSRTITCLGTLTYKTPPPWHLDE